MKQFFLAASLVLSALLTQAQPPNVPANKGDNFGAKVTEENLQEVDALPGILENKPNAEVKVYAKVAEVCTKEGCWIKVETANGKMMVKMKDHAFLVPTALVGKYVLIEGNASWKTTSVAELKHLAEDAGKSKKEIDAIKDPVKSIVMTAKGILVMSE
ncbi:MAG: DUF4920 domain-containing protein [Chitinophagaceae bacterium]